MCVGVIWLAAAFSVRSATNAFESACVAYETRDFAGAARLFADEIKHAPSAEAWRNWGNAEWQIEHHGAAVLAWERALWINPYDADALISLRYTRQSMSLTELPLRWWETFSTRLPADTWAWLATGSFWLAVALAFVGPVLLGSRRSAWTQTLAAVAFGVLLVTITGAAGIHTRGALGVIVSSATPLRQTPTQHAQILTKLAAGEVARCGDAWGNYLFVRSSGGEFGWIENRQIEFISITRVPAEFDRDFLPPNK